MAYGVGRRRSNSASWHHRRCGPLSSNDIRARSGPQHRRPWCDLNDISRLLWAGGCRCSLDRGFRRVFSLIEGLDVFLLRRTDCGMISASSTSTSKSDPASSSSGVLATCTLHDESPLQWCWHRLTVSCFPALGMVSLTRVRGAALLACFSDDTNIDYGRMGEMVASRSLS
jgi:hypothetical protein